MEETRAKPVARTIPAAVAAPPRRHRPWALVLFILGALLVGGCILLFLLGRGLTHGHVASGQYKGYNLLLVTLDTARADHLPVYGYTRVRTPNLDALAARGVVFHDAISHAPLTLPAHTSIMTGLLPITHGVRDNGAYVVDPKEITLATVLKSEGYATSAFVSAFVLDSRWGLNRGFDLYFDHFNLADFENVNPGEIQRRGDETEREAERWLREHQAQKFFSWVHFYDPHDPYDPPEPYKSAYGANPYDGELAFTDDVLGRLLKTLDELGLADRTIVLVTGDHGEGLGQHQETTHGMLLYNSTLHVPLILRVPGRSREDVDGVVRHIDVAPTLLDLLGLEIPKSMQGSSLISLMNGTEKGPRTAFSESSYAALHYAWSPLVALSTDEYKYIDAPKAELYDRRKDPGETANLIDEKPLVAKELARSLSELVASDTRADQKGPQAMDPETEEKLRALGYLGGTATGTTESRRIDPKDKMAVHENIVEAFRAVAERDYRRGLELVTPVLKQDPEIIDAHYLAGVAHSALGRYPEAIDELMQAVRARPDYSAALYRLGHAYEMLGNLEEAEHWYLQVLKYKEHHVSVTLKLARLYQMMNEPQKAKPYFLDAAKSLEGERSTTTLPKSKAALLARLGESYYGAGDYDRAEESLKAALALTPGAPSLHYSLALVYGAKREFAKAVEQLREEVEVAPDDYRAINNLGILYVELGRLEEAVHSFERVIQLRPQDERGYLLLASTYRRMGRQEDANRILQSNRQRRQPSNPTGSSPPPSTLR